MIPLDSRLLIACLRQAGGNDALLTALFIFQKWQQRKCLQSEFFAALCNDVRELAPTISAPQVDQAAGKEDIRSQGLRFRGRVHDGMRIFLDLVVMTLGRMTIKVFQVVLCAALDIHPGPSGFHRAMQATLALNDAQDRRFDARIIDSPTFDAGIRDLYRAAEMDGIFCYTFFKSFAEKR